MNKLLIPALYSVAIFISVQTSHAAADEVLSGKTGHSKSISVLTCDDMTAVTEAMDYMKHDPRNPNLLTIMQQGNCSPLDPSVSFNIIKQYIWQIPAGPQRLAQIEIPYPQNPSLPPATQWILESDIDHGN